MPVFFSRLVPLLTGRNLLILGVVGLLAFQQIQLAARARQVDDLLRQLAETRGAITRLEDAAKTLRPGERVVVEVPRPQYIPYPVAGPPGPLRIEYIREPGRIETRVQTIQLPGKEIERVIDKSPQSIIAELTATRDIKAGEKFRVVVAQVSPGVWQPIFELGAPITADVRAVTPIDRIPAQPRAEARLRFGIYSGLSSADSWVTGVRATYRVWPSLSVEGSGEHRWRSKSQDYRLLVHWTF